MERYVSRRLRANRDGLIKVMLPAIQVSPMEDSHASTAD
jgi:hypothetical protein